MKVTLYLEPSGQAIGGAEVLAANTATFLREHHTVEIVHHRAWIGVKELSELSGADLGGVAARYVARRPSNFASPSNNPWRMYSEPKKWGREIAGDADALIAIVHQLPPFNAADHGILWVLFPTATPWSTWPLGGDGSRSLRARAGRTFYRRQYDALMAGYQTKLAISHFSARWAKARWRIDCGVLAPLVDCGGAAAGPKRDLIASVGRFSVIGVAKHQREMALAFHRCGELADWELLCVGAARSDDERAYVDQVKASGPRVSTVVNASRPEVEAALRQAKVFWHAAGMNESEQERPEMLEHFGMVTVEAMAHGCVPVVIGRGGQAEIVDDGVNGILCDSLDDMVRATAELSKDLARWQRMSDAARARAAYFGRQSFKSQLREVVAALSPATAVSAV